MKKVILFLREIGPKRLFFGLITLIIIIGAGTFLLNREKKLDSKFQTAFDSGLYKKTIAELEPKIYAGEKDPATLRAVAAAYIQKAMAEPARLKQSTSLSIAYLQASLKGNPQSDEAYRLLGLSYFIRRDYENAELNYKKAIEISGDKNSQAYVGLGLIAEANKDFKNALEKYKEAMRVDPSSETAILGVARGLLFEKKRPTDAIKLATSVINSKNKSVLIDAYTVMANAYSMQNNYTKAISMYQSAVSSGSKDPYIHLLLAQAYINQYFNNVRLADFEPMTKNALAETEKALVTNPKYIYAYVMQYRIYSYKKDTAMMKQTADKILSLLPEDTLLSEQQKTQYADKYKSLPSVKINNVKITEVKNGVSTTIKTTNTKK